jgi:hypothetical protein
LHNHPIKKPNITLNPLFSLSVFHTQNKEKENYANDSLSIIFACIFAHAPVFPSYHITFSKSWKTQLQQETQSKPQERDSNRWSILKHIKSQLNKPEIGLLV